MDLNVNLSKYTLIIPAIIFLLQSCNSPKPNTTATTSPAPADSLPNVEIPLNTMKDGVLTVLMDNSLSSYFIYRGEPMGYDYDMLKLFTEENDLTLNIKIIGQVENIIDSLMAGEGDLVAANLAISEDRMEKIAFSESLFRTSQVLVQRLPENIKDLNKDQIEKRLIRDRLDLEGKTVVVRKNSSYELILQNLIRETGIALKIKYADSDAVTEDLFDMVSNGQIDYTLCDKNKAVLFRAYYDNLDINTPMSLSQPIAWGINKASTELLASIDSWIEKRKGAMEFNMIYNKYFTLDKRMQRTISKEYDVVKDGKISVYDDLLRQNAQALNWDWRLLAALVHKESRFNPQTKSWRGAVGLMQLMPKTAGSYGVSPAGLTNPAKNIMAGTKHLAMLEKHWKSIIPDSLECIKFTLGSYNVGLGHVEDAVRLAKKYQLKTDVWDDNVAKMLLNKAIPKYYKDPIVKYGYCRGREPVNYVKSILEYYAMYSQFTG